MPTRHPASGLVLFAGMHFRQAHQRRQQINLESICFIAPVTCNNVCMQVSQAFRLFRQNTWFPNKLLRVIVCTSISTGCSAAVIKIQVNCILNSCLTGLDGVRYGSCRPCRCLAVIRGHYWGSRKPAAELLIPWSAQQGIRGWRALLCHRISPGLDGGRRSHILSTCAARLRGGLQCWRRGQILVLPHRLELRCGCATWGAERL